MENDDSNSNDGCVPTRALAKAAASWAMLTNLAIMGWLACPQL